MCGWPPAAHTSSYAARSVSTSVRSGSGCPTGATPPIANPVWVRTKSGSARSTAGRADQGGHLGGVDPVPAGGHHQQGSAVGAEHQRVGDLGDPDAELLGGLGGGAGRVVEQADPARDAELGQPRGDPADRRVGQLAVVSGRAGCQRCLVGSRAWRRRLAGSAARGWGRVVDELSGVGSTVGRVRTRVRTSGAGEARPTSRPAVAGLDPRWAAGRDLGTGRPGGRSGWPGGAGPGARMARGGAVGP